MVTGLEPLVEATVFAGWICCCLTRGTLSRAALLACTLAMLALAVMAGDASAAVIAALAVLAAAAWCAWAFLRRSGTEVAG